MATERLLDSKRDNSGDFIGECTISQSCEPCMKTNVSKTATFFCNDCNEFLCDTCKNPHTVYKPGRHDIVNIQDRKSVPVGVDMKGMDICPEHGKEIEFFCKDHSNFCCSKCVLIHRKCDHVDEIASASGQERPKLKALHQSIIKLQSEADAIITDCKQSETGLNESIANISSEVDKMRDRIVQLFEEAKKKLITDAKQFTNCTEVKRIRIKSEASLKVKEEIYKVLPMFCSVLEHGTSSQQYIYSKIIQDKNNTWQSIINNHRILKMSTTVTVSFPRVLTTLLEMGNDFIKLNCDDNNPAFPGKWEINRSELELYEDIGSGSFATVQKGKWDGRNVAVKMIRERAMSEDSFLEEAKTMTQLSHPNLVQLIGVVTMSKPLIIVTELMEYGALPSYFKRHKTRLLGKVSTLVDMCFQVCSGMEYLESRSFIHRDVAARNCLVGFNQTIKIADFSLARYVIDDEYTCHPDTKFPLRWSPPEVLSFIRFSSKSDVWAFGVLMWEVFTGGEMPYGQMRNAEVVDFVCNNNRRLVKPQGCPQKIYMIMMDCWHKDPESRPSFAQLSRTLKSLVEDDYPPPPTTTTTTGLIEDDGPPPPLPPRA